MVDSVASTADDSRPRGVVPIVIGNLTMISSNSANGQTEVAFIVTCDNNESCDYDTQDKPTKFASLSQTSL